MNPKDSPTASERAEGPADERAKFEAALVAQRNAAYTDEEFDASAFDFPGMGTTLIGIITKLSDHDQQWLTEYFYRCGYAGWLARSRLAAATPAWEAILQLTHQLDDAAQGITERQAYDFATAIRMQLGLDGPEAAVKARGHLGSTPWGETDDH